MAATALRPLALNFMDLLAGSDCEVDEFQLSNQPDRMQHLDGRSLAELGLGRRSGATVLAILTPSTDTWNPYGSGRSELQANPGGHVLLHSGQRLVVMGSSSQLQEFARLLGPALESAESVQP
jgi:voltage-gated potassium channel